MTLGPAEALSVAAAVRAGVRSATDVVTDALAAIEARDGNLGCFVSVFREDACRQAAEMETTRYPGLLAGVPFAVKDLFDVAGRITRAGSVIRRDYPPAREDATAVGRLRQAGAVPLGSTNMDEFAFGFTTENPHYGPTRNPWDRARIAGGSSGGSAAAVADGLVPIALGTDTNGSVRVPAALCGVYGFKPTYGRISRAGTAPLAWSFDHVGFFARSTRDIAAVFDVLQGADPRDPVCIEQAAIPVSASLERGAEGLRIAIAGGHFSIGGRASAFAAVDRASAALNVRRAVDVPEAGRAVAASLLITSSEAASLHVSEIRARPDDFDPHTRDRWIAATMIPSIWYHAAQRFRRAFREKILKLFEDIDVLVTPTTPFEAPLLGQGSIEIDGSEVPVRPTLARFVAPFSFVGCPALSAPVRTGDAMPLGVQIVAAPHNDTAVLRVAHALEETGEIGSV